MGPTRKWNYFLPQSLFFLSEQCVPARYDLNIWTQFRIHLPINEPCYVSGGLFPNLLSRSLVFSFRSVRVIFVVDQLAPRQGLLQVLRVLPVKFIPPILHTHLYLHVTVTRKTSGESLETFKKAPHPRKSGNPGWKSIFTFSILVSERFLNILR
jgi:hypothetical protein